MVIELRQYYSRETCCASVRGKYVGVTLFCSLHAHERLAMASAGAAGSSTGDSSGSGGGFQLVRKGARPRRRVSIQRQSSPAPSRLDIVAAVMRAK